MNLAGISKKYYGSKLNHFNGHPFNSPFYSHP